MMLNEAAGGPEQVEHGRETGHLARQMSKALCPMVAEDLSFAGYLHEIGKVSMPRELVVRGRTGGDRSEEERRAFQGIREYAVRILTPNRNLRERMSFIAHLGRAGYEEMPLEAQILKVAADYSAFRNPAYRNLSEAEALQRIREGTGTLYNPRVVAALE